jgi:Cys-tRNA(Pro) deacylase
VSDHPVTLAVRMLRERGVSFAPHLFPYVEHGGTAHSSTVLSVSEHEVIKTLVFEDEEKKPLIVLMHGDRSVSTKTLARDIGAKRISACAPDVATQHSGYLVGGTSPFGLKKPMPIYMERSITDLPRLFINGGGRGFLVELAPADVVNVLSPTLVNVAIEKKSSLALVGREV